MISKDGFNVLQILTKKNRKHHFQNLKRKMGPYLGTPNKDKHSENGENEFVRYGATSM